MSYSLGSAAALALVFMLASPAGAAPREYTVTMSNMSYGRVPGDVKVGDTIIWVNHDSVVHTATARDKSFDARIQVGQSARTVMSKAGTIPFYCIYHAQMRGTLKVAAQ